MLRDRRSIIRPFLHDNAMPSTYDPKSIEPKWRKYWEENKTFRTEDPSGLRPPRIQSGAGSSLAKGRTASKGKFYALIEFPYPSGEGLHVGHPRSYTAMDIIVRKRRMEGYDVLYPIGFDAFGLPAENYAIKTKTHPAITTQKNIAHFTDQLKSLGFSFDWDRAVDTTDPDYYKWTQWIFLQLYKHGLAYKTEIAINWCLNCKIGLANEEVIAGRCERCGGPVEKRLKSQWMLKITEYADRLLSDLDSTQYLEKIKTQQREWIGKKQGINITYRLEDRDGITAEGSPVRTGSLNVTVFTTRPDTNFGATFVVIGPEHQLIANPQSLGLPVKLVEGIEAYKKETILQKDFDRTADNRKKTGVFTGLYCVNPLNGYRMPLYVADYVLGNVGTGAVVGVPGHDKRDFEFAQAFNIPVVRVVQKDKEDVGDIVSLDQVQEHEGTMINSGFLDGMDIHAATGAMMDHIEKEGYGKRVISYKLRDWVFSRQRYWGEPIPLVYCEKCAQKKHRFVLLHGYNASPTNEKFFPWLQRELEGKGFEVVKPEIDFSKGSDAAVEDLLAKGILDCDTTVIAYSLSGSLMLKLLATGKAFVHQLLMVAPPIAGGPFRDGKERPGVSGFCDWKFDYEAAKENAAHITVLSDLEDHIIPPAEPREAARKLGAYLKEVKAAVPHFGSSEAPEILTAAMTCMKLNPGWIPLPDDHLPLKLPDVPMYEPTDTGESPLANLTDWINVPCPQCGSPAKRETDTMPNWAGSSWYFLRYIDPRNNQELASMDKLKEWMEVDWYNGGMEHTTLHLLYSRFWNKFLYDIGAVPTSEPYMKRTSHGMILGEGGMKMSKSKGNVVNPDDIVARYGADTLRLYEMFMGPFDQAIPWDSKGVEGCHRFIQRVWKLVTEKTSLRPVNAREGEARTDAEVPSPRRRGPLSTKSPQPPLKKGEEFVDDPKLTKLLHKTIKKVGEDIERMGFNTAVSACMILLNEAQEQEKVSRTFSETFVMILSPFVPFMAEELWSSFGNKASVSHQPWPAYDPALVKDDEITLVVQVNGKVRDSLTVPADITKEDALKLAYEREDVKKWIEGKKVSKEVFVPGKLVSIVAQ